MNIQDINIETAYHFNKIDIDPLHYGECYELAGRYGALNIIDQFASDPRFPKCYVGVLAHDETQLTVDVWFNNTTNFPHCYEEYGRRLSFTVHYRKNIGYTGSRVNFFFQKDSLQLCFLKKQGSASADSKAVIPTLKTEVALLMPQFEELKPIKPTPAVDNLKLFGGIRSVNFQHYGTDIRFSTIPNLFNG